MRPEISQITCSKIQPNDQTKSKSSFSDFIFIENWENGKLQKCVKVHFLKKLSTAHVSGVQFTVWIIDKK